MENIITNLTNKELAVIKAVDELGSATIGQIAKKTGIKRTTIYNFADKLVDCDMLCLEVVNGIKHYFLKQKELTVLEAENRNLSAKSQKLQLLSNLESIRKCLWKTLDSPQVSWFIGSPQEVLQLGKKFMERYLKKAAESGVDIRILRSPFSDFDFQIDTHDVGPNCGSLDQKTNHQLPFKTTIVLSDSKAHIISSEAESLAYTLADQELLGFLSCGYQKLWESS